jgi:hypothetical protein
MSEWNPNLPEVPMPKKNKANRHRKAKRPPKKRGRKRIVHPFDKTPLGYSFRLYAPLEYEMVMEASGDAPPNPDFIEEIGYASANPYFRMRPFRRLLIRYRKEGCACGIKRIVRKRMSVEIKEQALKTRMRRMYGR